MPLDGHSHKKQFKGAVNLAPLEPLRQIKDRSAYKNALDGSTLTSIFKKIHDELKNRNYQMRREIAETGRLLAGLRSGKQIIARNPLDGHFALLPPLPQKPKRGLSVVPLAQVKSSELTSTWGLSKPRVEAVYFGNTVKSQIQHAVVNQVVQDNDLLFDVDFEQRESLSMMDYGTSIIRPFYDDNINTITHVAPVIESERAEIFEGYAFCRACGHENRPEKFKQNGIGAQCPECGSYTAHVVPAQYGDASRVTGFRVMRQGGLAIDLLDVPACNWDMKYLVQDSSFFTVTSDVSARLVESVLGIEVQESVGSDYFLNIVSEISNRGGGVEGYGRERLYNSSEAAPRRTSLHEEWIKPEWYTGERLQKEEKTVSGEKIPKGTPLEEIFPEGVCVVGFNDLEVITGIFPEKCRAISSVYHIQSHSGVGKGISDTLELSEQLNIAHTAAIEQLKRLGAGGGFAYDKDSMTLAEAKQALKPDGLVGMSLRTNPHLRSVSDGIGRIRADVNLNAPLALVAQLTNFINIAFQATDFTQGTAANTVDVNTLGGQQLLAAQNQMRASAPLRMKGYSRAKLHEELLALFRDYIKIPVFFGTGDKFALAKGRYIGGEYLPEQIKCAFVLDSEHPNDKFTQRENVIKMSEASMRFSGLPFSQFAEANPRLAAWYADQFDAVIPNFNYGEMLIVCQERLDELKEIVEQSEMVFGLSGFYPPEGEAGDSFVDALSKPVETDEENHTVKAEIIGAFLDDDEVSEWSNYRRAAVRALINRHYTAEKDRRLRPQMLAQDAEMELAKRQNDFQMRMQNEQAQLNKPANEATVQQNLLTEGLGRAADQIVKEDDFSREQEGKSLDHARQMELEDKRLAIAAAK